MDAINNATTSINNTIEIMKFIASILMWILMCLRIEILASLRRKEEVSGESGSITGGAMRESDLTEQLETLQSQCR